MEGIAAFLSPAPRLPECRGLPGRTESLSDLQSIAAYHRTVVEDGQQLIGWQPVTESLNDESGNPRWLSHADGSKIDVAALPVAPTYEIKLHPLPLALAQTNLFAGVGETVSIVGYPLGITGGGAFPIWKTGHIASEPEIDREDLPVFLVDATTRRGMSGSPVYRRFHGLGWRTRRGTEMMDSRTVRAGSSELTRFMGVYAGRRVHRTESEDGEVIEEFAELGRVWKPHVIEQILEARSS